MVKADGRAIGWVGLVAALLVAGPAAAAGLQNVAGKGQARQSSVEQGGAATRAIDGKTDGVFAHGSVTSTTKEPGAWWELDLGGERAIQAIEISRRSDCCGEELTGAVVELRGKPCDWDSQDVRASRVVDAASGATIKMSFEPGTDARWVCVRHTREERLSLAEVAVYASTTAVKRKFPGEAPAPKAEPAPAQVCPALPLVASVIPTAGQVLYVGVDNPVTVRVPGAAAADLELSATCPFSGSAGQYVFRPIGGNSCGVSVAVRSGGVAVPATESTALTVRRVPDPVAYVGNVKGDGQMTKAELQSQAGVFARIENFPIDVKFTVVSFVLAMNINGVDVEKKANGPGMTADMKSMLAGARVGTRVIVEQVTVQGPDGTLRKIPGVVLKVK